MSGLAVYADVFEPPFTGDPVVSYGSQQESDYLQLLERTEDTRTLRFRFTFRLASENEMPRELSPTVVFEGEQVASFCP